MENKELTNPKTPGRKTDKSPYHTPELQRYGELRDLSKGAPAYSTKEGAYQEFPTKS